LGIETLLPASDAAHFMPAADENLVC
jgi:hypothetical protein